MNIFLLSRVATRIQINIFLLPRVAKINKVIAPGTGSQTHFHSLLVVGR